MINSVKAKQPKEKMISNDIDFEKMNLIKNMKRANKESMMKKSSIK